MSDVRCRWETVMGEWYEMACGTMGRHLAGSAPGFLVLDQQDAGFGLSSDWLGLPRGVCGGGCPHHVDVGESRLAERAGCD